MLANFFCEVHRCHAALVLKWVEQNLDDDWKPRRPNDSTDSGAAAKSRLPLSFVPIRLQLPDAVREILQAETEANCPSVFHPEVELLPATCACGEKWKQHDEQYSVGTYYTPTFTKRVLVYCRKCVNNKCLHHFDGQSTGTFNYSGETLISYSLLRNAFNCCVRNGMSWSGYIGKITSMYNDIYSMNDCKMPFLSGATFSKV